jgi:hypothetical protein
LFTTNRGVPEKTITPPKPGFAVAQVSTSSAGNHVLKSAQLVPTGAGLVSSVREMLDADCPTDDGSDLERSRLGDV